MFSIKIVLIYNVIIPSLIDKFAADFSQLSWDNLSSTNRVFPWKLTSGGFLTTENCL